MYVSPLKRIAQTLSVVYPNCNYIVDERLIEISLGSWEGLEKTAVDQSKRKGNPILLVYLIGNIGF